MIRVLVKASSPLLQAGLERMLGAMPEVELVGGGGERLRQRRGDHRSDDPAADVLLVELEGEDDPGDLAELFRGGAAVVLLLDEPSSAATAEALRAGVKAVLPRSLRQEELLAAVQAAAAGLVVLHADDVAALLPPARAAGAGPRALVEPLTQREGEVLAMMAEGLANKEIAARLAISEHTVKFHVASVMSKLGAVSRTEAVTAAIRRGLLFV